MTLDTLLTKRVRVIAADFNPEYVGRVGTVKASAEHVGRVHVALDGSSLEPPRLVAFYPEELEVTSC